MNARVLTRRVDCTPHLSALSLRCASPRASQAGEMEWHLGVCCLSAGAEESRELPPAWLLRRFLQAPCCEAAGTRPPYGGVQLLRW
eukprot:3228501-Pyramimonas_sp.AAC.1